MGVKAPPSGGAAIATRPCIGNLGTLSAPPGEEEMSYSIAGIDVHKKPYDRPSWVTPADENGSDGWLSIEGGLGRAAEPLNGA